MGDGSVKFSLKKQQDLNLNPQIQQKAWLKISVQYMCVKYSEYQENQENIFFLENH